jgi:type II secretory pathway pseudopilin PulG
MCVYSFHRKLRNDQTGLTLVEALVVMVVVAFLALYLLADMAGPRPRQKATRISCVNNLKQVGTAYRIWENDHGDLYPMSQKESLGGMAEILSNSISAGSYAYLPYSIMQNELGQSPKVVLCPADERTANTNFFPGANAPTPSSAFNFGGAGTFDNTNVSYFVGVGASDTYPQSILAGDRNLGNAGKINPANGAIVAEQDPDFGISGATANPGHPCGADAIVNTNGAWSFAVIAGGGGRVGRGTDVVGWSAKMHSAGNTAGAGNILLGDGSAQQCTSAAFRLNWLKNASDLGNFANFDRLHTTNNGSVRFLFP